MDTPPPEPPRAPPLEIAAPALSWEKGAWTASGGVEVRCGAVVVRAPALTGDRTSARGEALTGEWGAWSITAGEGRVWFADGPAGRGGAAELGAARVAPNGCDGRGVPLLAAETLALSPEGVWTAREATLAPCACPPFAPRPLLTLSARSMTVVPEQSATLRGGWVRVWGAPVLPVPWARVALAPEAWRVGVPEVGFGTPGWSARWTAQGGVGGGYRLRPGLAWREDRGARVVLGLTGPAAEGAGELGWDGPDARVRGIVESEGGLGGPTTGGVPAALAWDGALATDRAFAEEYGTSFVSRGVEWRDARGVAALGPGRLGVWLPDDGSVGEVVGVGQRWGVGGPLGRWSLDGGARVAVVGAAAVGGADREAPLPGEEVGRLEAPPALAEADVRVGAGATVSGSRTWGIVHAEGRLDGEGWVYGSGEPGARVQGRGRLELPMWSEGWVRAAWWPGLFVEGAAGGGEARLAGDAVLSPVRPVPTWAGVALRADAARGGLGWAADLRLGATPDGVRPEAVVDLTAGRGSARLSAAPEWQSGEARLTLGEGPRVLTPWVGAWMETAGGLAAWGGADARWGAAVAGLSVAWDLGEERLSAASARLGYDDGCAGVQLTAALSPDRELPDLGLAFTWRR